MDDGRIIAFSRPWDEFHSLVAGNVIELSRIRPGMHVADLCCGLGAIAMRAAFETGPSGRVTALDRDPIAIHQATSQSRARGLTWVNTVLDVAENWTGVCDRIVCSLGLSYLNNQANVLRKWHRCLGDDGLLILTEWLPSGPANFWDELRRIVGRYVALPTKPLDVKNAAEVWAQRFLRCQFRLLDTRLIFGRVVYPTFLTFLADFEARELFRITRQLSSSDHCHLLEEIRNLGKHDQAPVVEEPCIIILVAEPLREKLQ
jgi:SAM-dependent methyltransferase